MTLLFGKYRGKVTGNIDPLMMGRVQVTAPAALGSATVWALPCTPFAGPGLLEYLLLVRGQGLARTLLHECGADLIHRGAAALGRVRGTCRCPGSVVRGPASRTPAPRHRGSARSGP